MGSPEKLNLLLTSENVNNKKILIIPGFTQKLTPHGLLLITENVNNNYLINAREFLKSLTHMVHL